MSRNEVRAGFEQQEEKEYGSGSGETDAEGRYELLVPRGAYTVTAGGWRQEFREGSPIYAEARVPGLVVTENGHLHDVDLQLEEGGILEGIVRNADGSPAPRAMLWFEGETQEVEVMLGPSDEGGHFRFCGVTVGKHLVSGYGRTGGVRDPARVEIVAGGTQRIELVLVGK